MNIASFNYLNSILIVLAITVCFNIAYPSISGVGTLPHEIYDGDQTSQTGTHKNYH